MSYGAALFENENMVFSSIIDDSWSYDIQKFWQNIGLGQYEAPRLAEVW